jgi:hypothetical protein
VTLSLWFHEVVMQQVLQDALQEQMLQLVRSVMVQMQALQR